MTYAVPMPSPTGRNRAGLYLIGAPARAVMAMDAALRRPARDQDEPDDDGIARVKAFLKSRLDPDSWARLNQMLQELSGSGSAGEPDDELDRRRRDPQYNSSGEGEDEPEDFRGDPAAARERRSLLPTGRRDVGREEGGDFGRYRRRFAHDARGDDYFDDFPANARVGFGYGG
jgi:hypothetical protein